MTQFTEEQKPTTKEPILLERGDGLGWSLNFNRPISYLILALILALPFGVAIYCAFWAK